MSNISTFKEFVLVNNKSTFKNHASAVLDNLKTCGLTEGEANAIVQIILSNPSLYQFYIEISDLKKH